MNEAFEGLEAEKRTRIINAALQEFSERGYDRASTNKIVKVAGIGKGMLFYYFQNKQSLYHYLLTYSLDLMLDDFLERVDTSEPDFIERMYQIAQLKTQLFTTHPHVIHFLATFMLVESENIPKEISEKYLRLQTLGFNKMYEGIDCHLFREDIDREKAFQLIRWSLDGYQQELKQRLRGVDFNEVDMEPYWQEFYAYLAVLKKVFYH